MNQVETVPVARPVAPATAPPGPSIVDDDGLVPCARPAGQIVYAQPAAGGTGLAPARPTDQLAIASAICGMTAIVPVVSQVLGLGLGIASLRRLNRAKRQGVAVSGGGWAWTGILTSGFALIGWVGFFLALALVGSSIAGTQDSLQAVLQNLPT